MTSKEYQLRDLSSIVVYVGERRFEKSSAILELLRLTWLKWPCMLLYAVP